MTASTPPPPLSDAAETPADLSRRYVLPEGDPYLANLAALWAVDAALAAQVEAVADGERYAVEPSRDGSPTVSVPGPNGQAVCLHSRYKPLDEAYRLVADIAADEHVVYYVHGLGLGYHLELLFDAAGEAAQFFVFEPDLALVRAALESRDLVRLIESRRVSWVTTADKAELFQRLQPHTALISVGAASVLHPPSLQVAPQFHEQLRQWTDEYAAFTRTSVNTLILNGRRTAENVARNIGWYISTPGPAHLKDRHKGKPAVIVSAGPSLRKNKHLLPGLKGQAVLVAVQTTLQPLLEMGVEPDYVTSLDYHDICTRFYEKLPPTLTTELVAEPKATSKIFSMFPGPVTLSGNDFAEQLLREMRLDKHTLPSGATVAHLAFYLAEHLGCDPIVLVGQDLGFSDGLCYAPGTSYEDVWRPELSRFCSVEMKQWEQIVRERYILRRIPDQQGAPMYTEERLFSYLQQFERDFAKCESRIIDASEGGAAKRGAEVMSLSEVISQFCTEPTMDKSRQDGHKGVSHLYDRRPPAVIKVTDPLTTAEGGPAKRGAEVMTLADTIDQFCAEPLTTTSNLHRGPDLSRGGEAVECLRKRQGEAGEIEEVAAGTLPLLQQIHDHIEDQALVNRLIGQIDALRARMNDLGHCYELVVQMTQQTELQRFRADRRLASSKLSGTEKQRRQVARDIDNCKGVIEAAVAFRSLMDEAIQRIQEMTPPDEAREQRAEEAA